MLRSYQGLEVWNNCSGWRLLSTFVYTIETLLNDRPSSNDKCCKYEAFNRENAEKESRILDFVQNKIWIKSDNSLISET